MELEPGDYQDSQSDLSVNNSSNEMVDQPFAQEEGSGDVEDYDVDADEDDEEDDETREFVD